MVTTARRLSSCLESPSFSCDDNWGLLPWADPYIAQLIASHEAEAPAHAASRLDRHVRFSCSPGGDLGDDLPYPATSRRFAERREVCFA